MLLNALKPLMESGIINEETKEALTEAWEAKLVEAKALIRDELREEFSRKYEHDKAQMVDALDTMVTEALTAEIKEFADDKRALAEDRVKFKRTMREGAEQFNKFMVSKLAEEIKELREDRKTYENSIKTLEKFVTKSLTEEIKEFEQDKNAVVETRVRLVKEGKRKLSEMQRKFIAKSARIVKEFVTQNLKSELTQLNEDVRCARENMFGRRLFEAFASEFAVTHLNENKEVAKLRSIVENQNKKLRKAQNLMEAANKTVAVKEREIRVIKESTERKQKIDELLKPLSKEKASVMSDLLENVQTRNLGSAFEKYLPAVLNNTTTTVSGKSILSEGRSEVTGNKTNTKLDVDDSYVNVVDIKRLAGLK